MIIPVAIAAQDKLSVEVVPNHNNSLEWEESLNFKIFIKDQNGLNRKADIKIDDKITGNIVEESTIQSGYHEYHTTVPFGKENGVYSIEFTAERASFESGKAKLDIEVNHYYIQLYADIRPAAKFILDWGESINYTIAVVDEYENVIEDADIWVKSELDGSVQELKTNSAGSAEIEFTVPNNKPDSTYKTYFLISKFGYTSNDTLNRRLQVKHITSVETETDEKIKIYPQPSGEYVIIEFSGEQEIRGFKLYDIYGKSIPINNLNCENYSNSYKFKVEELTSGVYFLEVDLGSNRIIKKIIISE